MPLKKGSQHFPTNQREWDQWTRDVPVSPDPNTVGTPQIKDGEVTYVKLQDVAPTSLIGNLHNTVQAPGAITAGADNRFLVRRSNLLTFDILADADIPDSLTRDTELASQIAAVTAAYIAADAALVAAQFLTGTYTGAFTGTTTDPAPVVRYSVSGKIVVLQLPSTTATSNATTFTLTGASVAIRPTHSQAMICRTIDNGVAQFSIATMDSAGTTTFGYGATGAAYTASGTKGFSAATLTYSLD